MYIQNPHHTKYCHLTGNAFLRICGSGAQAAAIDFAGRAASAAFAVAPAASAAHAASAAPVASVAAALAVASAAPANKFRVVGRTFVEIG